MIPDNRNDIFQIEHLFICNFCIGNSESAYFFPLTQEISGTRTTRCPSCRPLDCGPLGFHILHNGFLCCLGHALNRRARQWTDRRLQGLHHCASLCITAVAQVLAKSLRSHCCPMTPMTQELHTEAKYLSAVYLRLQLLGRWASAIRGYGALYHNCDGGRWQLEMQGIFRSGY